MNDIEIAATGTRLPIRETYHVIENVQVTLQDDGGQAISVKVMDKDPKRGPLIACLDAEGNRVKRHCGRHPARAPAGRLLAGNGSLPQTGRDVEVGQAVLRAGTGR